MRFSLTQRRKGAKIADEPRGRNGSIVPPNRFLVAEARSAFGASAFASWRLCVKRTTFLTLLASSALVATAEPVRITYWEKWAGFEAEAMRAVVDRFNASQDRIVVDFVSISQIDRKLIVATAGGNPPDVAGIWFAQMSSFADRAALTPLDDFIRRDTGSEPADWLAATYPPVFAEMQRYRNHVYALISAPSTIALYWNKTAFREAGLDPEKPPRTLAELDAMSQKLTRRDPQTGALLATGFLPQEPGWFSYAYPSWFGGRLVDEDGRVALAGDPANLAAARWEQSFPQTLGVDELKGFAGGFGSFASTQQAFFTGRVAMVFQGAWYDRFIARYAPGLDYGVAAWPEATDRTPGPPGQAFTVADADLLVIPRGAAHPEEAWEFIRYATSANLGATSRDELRGVELLCFAQQKASPLRTWSPWFAANHPNPHIEVFRHLAESPRAWHVPMIGVWTEYLREYTTATQRLRLLLAEPDEAWDYVQRRVGASLERHERSVARQARASAAQSAESREDAP